MGIGEIEHRGTVHATNGRDRLKLFYEFVDEDTGRDFHSIVWERRTGSAWGVHRTLSRDDFQWQHPNGRWVSDIHSISPEEGHAVLKMAETSKPLHPPQGFSVIYSWRIWDLVNNREVKLVRVCEPFEKYDES